MTTTYAVSIGFSVIISLALVVYLYRYLGWGKTILLIIAISAVDIDHFLFGSKGFLETPAEGEKILHAFNYGVEFTVLVIAQSLAMGSHTFKLGWKAWLFPQVTNYPSKWSYYLAWTSRLILLGVLIHYALDLPIYALNGKWDHYDYSVIHYLLTKN
jgi:hypothetical protein